MQQIRIVCNVKAEEAEMGAAYTFTWDVMELDLNLAAYVVNMRGTNSSLVFYPNVLSSGSKYSVEVTVSQLMPPYQSMQQSLILLLPNVAAGEDTGKCSIQPPSGRAAVTRFRIECSGWSDAVAYFFEVMHRNFNGCLGITSPGLSTTTYSTRKTSND